jgi:hypothetical protein
MFARTWAKRRLQERIGQPLSFDENSNPNADVVHWTEGKTDGTRDREWPDDPAWSETLACADAHVRPMGTVRIGKTGSRSR